MTNVDKLFQFIMENLEEVKKQVKETNPEDFDKKEERKEAEIHTCTLTKF